jgi:hypothetical protein
MEPITSLAELKNAIQILEFEQTVKEQLLKEQLNITYESLKPVNLIKSALNEVVSSPYIIDNIIGVAMGLTSGYITKKIALSKSGSIIRKILGTLLEFGITNIVAQNTDSIKSFGQSIYQYFLRKKK